MPAGAFVPYYSTSQRGGVRLIVRGDTDDEQKPRIGEIETGELVDPPVPAGGAEPEVDPVHLEIAWRCSARHFEAAC